MHYFQARHWTQCLLPLVVIASACLFAATAQAHPHVWATMKAELLYAQDGSVTGLRQVWTFDDMYSAFATIAPIDYCLTYDPKATVLTLHFTLPFKTPVKAKVLKIEIYDPEFFIDFAFADKEPIKLVGAPALCAAWTEKPSDPSFVSSQQLNNGFVPSEAYVGMGMNFANKILVQCP